ncbi:MAG: gamma-glutamyltransferase family protein [Alphaproteobacteria bacterium]
MPRETWRLAKPAVASVGGIVSSQHHLASAIGAKVLSEGGNAIDAALATSFALAAVEPWMSGLGGGGYMVVRFADAPAPQVVEFGMVSPQALDPADYPLTGATAGDLFAWPGVLDDRNVHGYHAIAVPGQVAGLALALERFGSRRWDELLQPAIALAERGLTVDWYATLAIAATAKDMRRYPAAASLYLPDGLPPAGEWSGPPPTIGLGNLAKTLRRLAEAGPRDFYEGEIARRLVADLAAGGSRIAASDLAGYEARLAVPSAARYRDATVYAPSGLTAGPTLHDALGRLDAGAFATAAPSVEAYVAYAKALHAAYAQRLSEMGETALPAASSCTSHIGVADRHGNLVALTQTLLSPFGARVVLPETGILMNNGIMWFDPRPGGPNSIGPAKRPLSNMCPTILAFDDGRRFALGASGGRRIMPAVMQIVSFLADFGMTLNDAFHTPRLDVSGTDVVTIDERLPPGLASALPPPLGALAVQQGAYPSLFANPNAAGWLPEEARAVGAVHVASPWSQAAPGA